MAHPVLPGGERLAVIGQESALRRVADIVALDAEAALVIMEIKNETALRSAVGQALEYLSQYEEASVESLNDDLRGVDERLLEQMFMEVFGKALTGVGGARRVIIVAPRFDHHSCHGISFLNRMFKGSGITFHLLQARREGNSFSTQFVEPPSLRHSSQLVGKFGQTPGRRLVFVLEGGSPQILWVLGQKRDGVLRFAKQAAVTQRTLRPGSRLLLPDDAAEGMVDFSLRETTWRSQSKPLHTAKVIGVVDAGRAKTIFFAQCKDGVWGFRKRELREFRSQWLRDDQAAPSWRQIVQQVRARKSRSSRGA